jgi:hypothetical protein
MERGPGRENPAPSCLLSFLGKLVVRLYEKRVVGDATKANRWHHADGREITH